MTGKLPPARQAPDLGNLGEIDEIFQSASRALRALETVEAEHLQIAAVYRHRDGEPEDRVVASETRYVAREIEISAA